MTLITNGPTNHSDFCISIFLVLFLVTLVEEDYYWYNFSIWMLQDYCMFLLSVYLFFMKILGSRKYMYNLVNSVENVCWLDGYTDFIFANYFVFPTLLGEAGSDCSSCIVLFDPLPALSLCLLHDIDTCSACISPLIKKTLNQTSYRSIFFPSLHYDANTVCYCCKDVLRPKMCSLCRKISRRCRSLDCI